MSQIMINLQFVLPITLYLHTEGTDEFSLLSLSEPLGKNRVIQVPQVGQQPLVKCLSYHINKLDIYSYNNSFLILCISSYFRAFYAVTSVKPSVTNYWRHNIYKQISHLVLGQNHKCRRNKWSLESQIFQIFSIPT